MRGSQPMTRHPLAAALLAAVIATIAANAGCGGGMQRIDSRAQQLLDQRSSQLGPDAYPPQREFDTPDNIDRARVTSTRLETVNPARDELRYRVADEARDVSERLERYQTDPDAEDIVALSLNDVLRVAQRSAPEYLGAEEDYIFAALRLLIERHRWSPRLVAQSSVSVSGQGDSGTFDSALRVVNEVRATQRLPFGGEVAARWLWEATEDLRRNVADSYVQSSRLVLDGQIPLLRGAGTVARENLIQSERDLVYAARNFEQFRRQLLVSIARDYFNLIRQRAAITNQQRQLDSLRRLEQRQQALFEAGRIAQFQVSIASSQVLSATAQLANLRESHTLALDRFKIRVGIPVETSIRVEPVVLEIPEPDVSPTEAAVLALLYRLDFQNRRDQFDDARRSLLNAQNQLLPDLNLSGSVGLRTDPDTTVGGISYDFGDLTYSAGVTFGLPLDREIERLQLRSATINLARQARELNRFRDNVVLEVRARVREIDRARFDLRLREEAVRINQRRLLEQELKSDEVTAQQFVETENDLLAAENARDQAITDLRNAILDFLIDTGQLRVGRDGTFLPLPGMEGLDGAPEIEVPDALPPIPEAPRPSPAQG